MQLGQLVSIMGGPERRCAVFFPHLIEGMATFEIYTPEREACFLATIGHESGGLRYTVELWGSKPTAAQAGYEGRADLGNTEPGDGYRYRGRGLIQCTGRANYAKASAALGIDYITDPHRMGEPRDAALVSCWWWKAHGCNELAQGEGFQAVTRRVNGGLNGWEDRQRYFQRALKALKPDFSNVRHGGDSTAPKVAP